MDFNVIPQELLENPISQVILSLAVGYYIMKKADANASDEAKDLYDNDISKTYRKLNAKLKSGDERIQEVIDLSEKLTNLIKEIVEDEDE